MLNETHVKVHVSFSNNNQMCVCFRGGGGTLGIFGWDVPLGPWNPFLGLRRPRKKLIVTFMLNTGFTTQHILPIT